MTDQTEREKFEAWAREQMDSPRAVAMFGLYPSGIVEGEYADTHSKIAWRVWQARAALDTHDPICSDCPPQDYPTDKTRCSSCPRRAALDGGAVSQDVELATLRRQLTDREAEVETLQARNTDLNGTLNILDGILSLAGIADTDLDPVDYFRMQFDTVESLSRQLAEREAEVERLRLELQTERVRLSESERFSKAEFKIHQSVRDERDQSNAHVKKLLEDQRCTIAVAKERDEMIGRLQTLRDKQDTELASLRRQLAEMEALITKAQLQKALRKMSAVIEETDEFGIPLKKVKP